MKLRDYAKKNSVSYRTAYRHWKAGLIKGRQLSTGTIVIDSLEDNNSLEQRAILYSRVSSSENKSNLDSQLERIRSYAYARGYKVCREIKEIGSGLNDSRKQIQSVLKSNDWDILIVEHKDRFSRFGTEFVSTLLTKSNKRLEVINEAMDDKSDLMQDFVSIITSFVARLYGQRRSQRKTEKIIAELNNDED